MHAEELRVLRLANFVSPTSGGIRTVLRRVSLAQAALGVRSVVVVPGPDAGIEAIPGVLDVGTLPGVRLVAGQSYRLMLERGAVRALLDDVRPDVVEIHDQLTLAWLGPECRSRGIRAILVAHERLDLLAAFWSRVPRAAGSITRWLRRIGDGVDAVVAPSRFAAAPYADAGIEVRVIPWGVDHETFRPASRAPRRDGALRLVHAGRLSAEKDPLLSARTAERLADAGLPVELLVIGSGPEAATIARHRGTRSAGFVDGPPRMAELLGAADVFLAPGPFETFGVSALEAMACGLPVVCRRSGSISEIPSTVPAEGTPEGFAEAALRVSGDVGARTRSVAAARQYTWERAAGELLAQYRA
ncbi:glycosyltransferase [Cumulibacter manganitolerans]|uniref:glycosyltransferase n=1 Tax=Cumulibacter manganitolerans TaxID=1884992 RepID=UPI001296BDFE|nr:glycosyltransferase [Cumulibacter manganitolerans]